MTAAKLALSPRARKRMIDETGEMGPETEFPDMNYRVCQNEDHHESGDGGSFHDWSRSGLWKGAFIFGLVVHDPS